MIIPKLMGGLGNQMFQYAAGKALANRLGVKLKLDISDFSKYQNREYNLNFLNIHEDFASTKEVKQIKLGKQKIIKTIFKREDAVVNNLPRRDKVGNRTRS